MATTNTIGSGINVGVQPKAATTQRFDDMKSEDFYSLLIAQLKNQDPLKPTDNQQILQQMSMIRQIQDSSSLNKSLDSLAHEQRFGATAGLIGQYVSGTVTDVGGNNQTVEGLVVAVRFDKDGAALLDLHNGKTLPASKVDGVTLIDNLPADVRQRLAAELAQLGQGTGGTGGTTGSTGSTGTPATPNGTGATGTPQTALLRAKTNDAASRLLDRLSAGADRTSSALEALLSQGVEVGI